MIKMRESVKFIVGDESRTSYENYLLEDRSETESKK